MKTDPTYKKARKLIDQRELDDANLDEAYNLLMDRIEEDASADWAYGLLSEIYYWFGETSEGADRMPNFEEGVSFGERGVAVNENSLESNFWLAVNYGSFGTEKGIMKSLSLIRPIKTCVERVLAIDEGYFYGGPWRVLGRLYHKAPGFPISIGDLKKSRECLEKALELGPKFYLNHKFAAELYISLREKDKAREHLEWILNAPLSKNHEIEDAGYKKEAEALLAAI